ncbi:MAG: hypothetical protein ACJ8DY_09815, partial [Xanthobacteraceae bacterium]
MAVRAARRHDTWPTEHCLAELLHMERPLVHRLAEFLHMDRPLVRRVVYAGSAVSAVLLVA